MNYQFCRNDMLFWNSKAKHPTKKIIEKWQMVESYVATELHHCLKITESSEEILTRSSDCLNLVFKYVPADAKRLLALSAILFFIELFHFRILLFCCCFYQSTSALTHS